MEISNEQLKAVEKLANGKILCGGVGSGKSRTSLMYYLNKVCMGDVSVDGRADHFLKKAENKIDLVIITTARKRDTLDWVKEALPFNFAWHGLNISVDSWNNIQKYSDMENHMFIFDEQRLVGRGVWVKTFLKIAKKNQWILLSATPGDTWEDYIPVFIANGFYKNRTQFNANHAVFSPYTKFPKVIRWNGVGHLNALRNRILVDIKTKRRPREDHYIKVKYDQKAMDIVKEFRWDIYKNEPIKEIARYTSVVRRINNENPSRISELSKIYSEISPKRLIIFYNYNYELELLRSWAKSSNVIYGELNGHRHDPTPTSKSWVYLVQYSSGAEAWNCTDTCHVLFYSYNYSYRIMEQAKGRIDRRNTTFPTLNYYYFESDSKVDKAIKLALKRKGKFNELGFAKKELQIKE